MPGRPDYSYHYQDAPVLALMSATTFAPCSTKDRPTRQGTLERPHPPSYDACACVWRAELVKCYMQEPTYARQNPVACIWLLAVTTVRSRDKRDLEDACIQEDSYGLCETMVTGDEGDVEDGKLGE